MGTKYVSMSLLYNNNLEQRNSEIPAEGKFIFYGVGAGEGGGGLVGFGR